MVFNRPVRPIPGEEIWGFVLPDNLLETDFSDQNRWLIEPYVFLGLRVDKTILPKEKILAETERRAAAGVKERGAERCPTSVRRAIKEQVEEELRSEARTKSTMIDIAWNLDAGYVLVGSTTTKGNDELRKRFLRAFGLVLTPMGPLREGDRPQRLGYSSASEVPPDSTRQILSWIHLVAESQGGRDEDVDDLSILVTDKISFVSAHSTVQIKGNEVGSRHEAGTAVKDGRLVCEAKLEMHTGERPTAACVLGGDLPDCKSLRFIEAGEEGGETEGDARVIRLILYEAFYSDLLAWAERFVQIRIDPTAWQDVLDRRASWAATVVGAEDEE